MAVGVDEASRAYERAMRNVAAAGPGVCAICRTFISPDHETCFPCGHQPANLAAVAPITYSENLGQMHLALRNYKDGGSPAVRRYAAIRLAAILWRFLLSHEGCVAGSAGVNEFDLVTAVPSSSPQRDRRSPFRQLVGWIRPLHSRTKRLLTPTGVASGERDFDPQRFRAVDKLSGESVLLLMTPGLRAAAHALPRTSFSKQGRQASRLS